MLQPGSYSHQIYGDDNQVLEVELLPGQTIQAENGSMSFMDSEVSMRTGTGQKAGLMTLFKRKTAGEDILLSIFTNDGENPAKVGFSPPHPAKLLKMEIDPHKPNIVCQRRRYLAGHPDVAISLAVSPARTAAFTSANLLMQRLYGQGQAFLTANGAIIQAELGPDQTYLTDPSAILAFEDTVIWGVKTSNNLSNIIWSKEKIFLLSLQGPGTIWLQSTANLSHQIKQHISANRNRQE